MISIQIPRRHDPKGFTLIELLVVIGIIGTLVGLTLPAVQMAREASHRAACANNLRQFSLAFQTHHDTYGFFPSGGWEWWRGPSYVNGSPAIGRPQTAGWGFQVLPFIEANNSHGAGALTAIGTTISVFFCPSRRPPQTVTYPDEYTPPLTKGADVTHALCDYAASNIEGTGAVREYNPVRIAEITDGLSSSLLLAEKRMNLTDLGKHQPDDNEGYTDGFDEDTVRSCNSPPAPDFHGTHFDTALHFGSSHSGSMNAAFGDGSVRRISYTIDPAVFRNLGNRSDGQIISSGDY